MKCHIINIEGKESEEISLPECFDSYVRKDLIHKVFWAMQKRQQQPYGAYILAGKTFSASGKQSHARRKWKSLYGKGMSRVPRKTMSRRGTQFYWIGAFIPGTKGGREAHPPKPLKVKIKINKKEKRKALNSAIAASASLSIVNRKYPKANLKKLPIIIESKILENNAANVIDLIEKITNIKIKKENKIRAGKGKRRGRKYKNVSKILFVVGENENPKNLKNYNLEITKVKQLNILHLAPGGTPGRIVVWTSKAIEELGRKEKSEKLGGK